MSRQKIEDRDQELIQKFRSVIHLKEQQDRDGRRRLAAAAAAVCCAILVSLFAYFLFDRNPPETIESSKAVTVVRPKADAEETVARKSSERPSPANSSQASAESIAAGANGAPESRSVPAEPVETQKTPPEQGALPHTGVSEAPPDALPSSPEPAPSTAGIRIVKIVACKQVANRQYVAPQTVFSLERDNRPDVWVWMDVRSDKQLLPYTLKHVYYVNGRKYASVPLEIRYPRMRTWSNITLKSPDLVGQWRVAVVDPAGKPLSEVNFSVTR